MANYTTIDDPTLYFSTTIYTGDGNQNRAVTIDGTGMQPDWLWVKNRSAAEGHVVGDSVRGASQRLIPNSTDAEANRPTNIASFTSTGFTVANGGVDGAVNTNSATYVSWGWKAGTSFTNDASSTGIGSIDSAGSVSTDAGFSIMTYTGTGSNATFAHGLSAVPKMAIFKDRSSTGYWMTYHQAVGNGANLVLNETNASSASSVWWNSTSPTSSVFSIGTSSNINVSGRNYVGYLFAEKQGYSKFGSYIANSNSSNFIYTGMKPAFLMVKQTDSGGNQNWGMFDNKRPGYNSQNGFLYANSTAAEDTSNATSIDLLSNGFQLRANTVGSNPGKSYIYMAFAENPFVTSTGVPATAR